MAEIHSGPRLDSTVDASQLEIEESNRECWLYISTIIDVKSQIL